MRERLKILQIIEATHGGVGRHVLDLCNELMGQGHEIHVAYSSTRMEPTFRRELHAIGGLRLYEIPMRRGPHPADAVALARLVAYGRANGPFSLLHGHSSKGGALARLAGAMLGRPALYTPNAFRTTDPSLNRTSRVFYRMCELALAKLGSEIVAVSEDERDHAIELGLDARRTHIVLNGLRPGHVPSDPIDRESLGLGENEIVAGFVGRLVHQKAPERLIEAAAHVDRPNVRWVIVGDGPLGEKLRALAHDHGLTSRILWLGARDGFSAMPVFDFLVMPSRYEGMPYVLIEALESGLPIIVSDVGGARHAVRDGVNGFVVAEGDIEGFTDAIRRLVDDATLRKTMATESKKLAGHFTTQRMVVETEEVYRIALKRHAC